MPLTNSSASGFRKIIHTAAIYSTLINCPHYDQRNLCPFMISPKIVGGPRHQVRVRTSLRHLGSSIVRNDHCEDVWQLLGVCWLLYDLCDSAYGQDFSRACLGVYKPSLFVFVCTPN